MSSSHGSSSQSQSLHAEIPVSASVAKTLTKLSAIPSNRSCADCKAPLVDASQAHASFSPYIEPPVSNYWNFRQNHRNFAPPGEAKRKRGTAERVIPVAHDPPQDPALTAAVLGFGGHGVFVCSLCGAAHKLLGPRVAVVHAVQDVTAWEADEVRLLAGAGGNARAATVLEAYMPSHIKRPNSESSIADRLSFARAKYEAMAFILPPSGPLSEPAWRNIVSLHTEWQGLWGADLFAYSLSGLELKAARSSSRSGTFDLASVGPKARASELPSRLVEYFCVIMASDYLDPTIDPEKCDLSKKESPEDILLAPQITDCYPGQDAYDDVVDFPEHVSTFVFPDGCRPSMTAKSPSFFTFVLTCSSGDRLYGGVLRLYDDDRDTEFLRKVLENSGYSKELPSWLKPRSSAPDATTVELNRHELMKHSKERSKSTRTISSDATVDDVIFLPKCLVVLSCYPFFDLWRHFLLKIYRIALVEAPLPMERFIANFVSEIPLPPPGKVRVKCGFTVDDTWTIERPPENELPLANFSYRPLFASLSISNIMVVMGCLMQEARVALLSKHYALLGPVSEALLSLLFPFHWQGMSLPVMPYGMLDILDAPVPYLVGLHSRYLRETPPKRRPHGVVFVDLDLDRVHLGFAEESPTVPRMPPSLPERHATKLKAKLIEVAACVYVMPDSQKVGTITTGEDQELNSMELPSYAVTISSEFPSNSTRRKDVFSDLDKAYRDNELLVPISGFLSEQGQFYGQEEQSPSNGKKKIGKYKFLRTNRNLSGGSSASFTSHAGSPRKSQPDENLLDIMEPVGFSASEIRHAFLRFFVSLFQDYKTYIGREKFLISEFLANCNMSSSSLEFVEKILKTQMFHVFVEERRENPLDPEVRFFDDSITAKINRSKKAALANMGKGKKQTSFLNESFHKVTETFTPPPPSNWGLPDDGRSYHYGTFPHLDPTLYGKIRPPIEWNMHSRGGSLRMSRRASVTAQANEQVIVAKAMSPVIKTHKMLNKVAKRGAKNLEGAIKALSTPFVPRSQVKHSSRKKRLSRSLSNGSEEFSEISLPSAFEMSEYEVSSAESLVLNARRKQAILIEIISSFQRHCRAWLERKRRRELRRKRGEEKQLPEDQSRNFRQRKELAAAVFIQCWVRCRLVRRRFLLLQAAIVHLQGLSRGRRVRFAYALLLRAIRQVQAVSRGCVVRKWLSFIFSDRIELYKRQIFLLWHQAHAPLAYRCKFWPLMQSPGFIRLVITETELERLWVELGIKVPPLPDTANPFERDSIRIASRLGISCETHKKAMKVMERIDTTIVVEKRNKGRLNGRGPNSSSRALNRVASERTQIYERLSIRSHDCSEFLEFCSIFSIPLKDKRKKTALTEKVWSNYDQADASVKLLSIIFPELRHSTDVCFVAPSKKSLRRFPSPEALPEPLDRRLWAHILFEERVRRNVSEVANAALRFVPELTLQLSGIQPRATTRSSRQLKAAMSVRGLSDLSAARLEVMREFLSSKKSRKKEGENGDKSYPGDKFWEKDFDRDLPQTYPGKNFWESNHNDNGPQKTAPYDEIMWARPNCVNYSRE